MRRVALALVLLLIASSLHGQSLDKAKLLYKNKLYDDAKRELVGVVSSKAPAEDKAEALNVLGDIAVDLDDYEAAVGNWTELIEKYPNTPAAAKANGKLPLARRLADVSTGAAPPAAGAAQAEPDPEEDEEEEEGPVGSGTVLVAGSAPEWPESADEAVSEFMDLLEERGVKVREASVGTGYSRAWDREDSVSVNSLLEHARSVGASSVLYIYMQFMVMEHMRVECYSADGRRLWTESVNWSAGIGPSSKMAGFIHRMSPKLEAHVGGSCLPVSREQR